MSSAEADSLGDLLLVSAFNCNLLQLRDPNLPLLLPRGPVRLAQTGDAAAEAPGRFSKVLHGLLTPVELLRIPLSRQG
jgi:hypothetical protein